MKVLLFCKKNCPYSERAINYLKTFNVELKVVFSTYRNEEIPSNIFSWRGEYILSFQNYFIIPHRLLLRSNLAINFHPGPPEYPGSGMVNWALYDQRKSYGVTAHIMNDKVDNGKILKVKRFNICKDETINSLLTKSQDYSYCLFEEIVNYILSKENPIYEDKLYQSNEVWESKVNQINQINQMSLITFDIESEELEKRIRAFHTPAFPISLKFKGKKFIYVPDS